MDRISWTPDRIEPPSMRRRAAGGLKKGWRPDTCSVPSRPARDEATPDALLAHVALPDGQHIHLTGNHLWGEDERLKSDRFKLLRNMATAPRAATAERSCPAAQRDFEGQSFAIAQFTATGANPSRVAMLFRLILSPRSSALLETIADAATHPA